MELLRDTTSVSHESGKELNSKILQLIIKCHFHICQLIYNALRLIQVLRDGPALAILEFHKLPNEERLVSRSLPLVELLQL